MHQTSSKLAIRRGIRIPDMDRLPDLIEAPLVEFGVVVDLSLACPRAARSVCARRTETPQCLLRGDDDFLVAADHGANPEGAAPPSQIFTSGSVPHMQTTQAFVLMQRNRCGGG